jgi:dephospho-CoA kinase
MSALHLGLTGGIGSGKSTVAALLTGHGAIHIDADALSRATTTPGGEAMASIRAAFGAAMITREGALDREAMRQCIFSDPTAKMRLEKIIHPLVGKAIDAQLQFAESTGAKCIVFDIPLLVESGHWRRSLQKVLVIDCLEVTQIARVVQRNAMLEEQVLQIMGTQSKRVDRLAAADMVLFNDGIDLDTLAAQVAEIAPQFGL